MTTSSDDGMPVRTAPRVRALPRARRLIVTFLVVLLSLIGLALFLVFWFLPWLGRRGDLNAPIEHLIRSTLNLPVKIAAIETDPMSRLAITHVSSIRAGTDRRFELECERISVLYSPWDLWSARRVEELIVVRPRLRLDLDRDLSGILRVPEVPEPVDRPAGPGAGDDEAFKIGHFSLQMGELQLAYGGQTLAVDGLNIDVFGLGDVDHTRFRAEARLGEAELVARGRVTAERSPSGERSFRIYDTTVALRGLDVGPFFPLVERFIPGLKGAGRVELAGKVEGTWPRRVSVDLKSSLEGFSAAMDEALVDDGALGLELRADVIGEMERIDFTARLDAAGKSYGLEREVQLIAEGRFEKESGNGLLTLGPSSRLVIPAFGEIQLDGAVRSLLSAPRVDLGARARGLDLSAVLRRLPESWSFERAQSLRGRLDFDASLRGPVEAPAVSVDWKLVDGAFAPGGGTVVAAAAVSGSVERLEGLFAEGETPVASSVRVRIQGLDAASVAALAGLSAEAHGLGGSATVELSAPEWRLDGFPDSLRVQATVEDFELSLRDGLVATEDATLSLDAVLGESTGASGEWVAQTELRLRSPLLLLGSVEEVLDEEPARLSGTWTFSRRSAAAGEGTGPERRVGAGPSGIDTRAGLTLHWPSLGPVAVELASTLVLEPGLRFLPLRLDLSAAEVSNERFLGIYLRDVFQERFSFLKGARFAGRFGFDLSIEVLGDGIAARGRIRSRDTGLSLPVVGLSAEAMRIDLPIALGSPGSEVRRGSIGIGALRLGGVQLADLEFPLRHEGASYRVDPVELELLGGTLRMDQVTIGPSAGKNGVDLSLGLEGMDLAALSGALGWPRVEGTVGADLRRVRVVGDRLSVFGGLRVRAFGGEIEFRDLTVDDFTERYFTAALKSGTIRELDLRSLGEVFRFGLVSGVLEGSVKDLVFTPGHLLRFDVDVQTVPRPGVDQVIDLRAIESVQRALSGYFAGLESVFARFRYAGFGFEAQLRGREFRLRGKHSFDGIEHLMYSRWWQFPRVRIINTRPGQTYDWKRIQENVKKLFRESRARER